MTPDPLQPTPHPKSHPHAPKRRTRRTMNDYQRIAGYVVVYGSVLMGIIVAANPVELGISPVVFRWLVILATFLTLVANKLPDVLPGKKVDPS